MGARLVSVESERENDFVIATLLWIGFLGEAYTGNKSTIVAISHDNKLSPRSQYHADVSRGAYTTISDIPVIVQRISPATRPYIHTPYDASKKLRAKCSLACFPNTNGNGTWRPLVDNKTQPQG